MTSTRDEIGAYDALVKAKPDEPIFTLLGHDPDAPGAILHWVDLRRARLLAAEWRDPADLREELIQCTEAEMVAHEFRRWRTDMPATDTTTPKRGAAYTGRQQSAEELSAAERSTMLAEALAHLREAAFHICEAKASFATLGLDNITLAVIEASVNEIADEHAPKRPGVQPDLPMPDPEVS